MNKIILISAVALLVSGGNSFAQKIWENTRGQVNFFSSTPVEDIEAVSKVSGASGLQAIINTEAGTIAFKVPMKTFTFKNSLMQEHFHENYMETDKKVTKGDKIDYPNRNGQFQGTMEPKIDFSKPGKYNIRAKGKFTIHGVTVDREFIGTMEVKSDQTAQLKSSMEVPLAEHNIERPQMLLMKIAEKIKVDVDFTFKPKK